MQKRHLTTLYVRALYFQSEKLKRVLNTFTGRLHASGGGAEGCLSAALMHSHRLYECLLSEDRMLHCCDEGSSQTRPLGAVRYE